jgi:hypothetical protein
MFNQSKRLPAAFALLFVLQFVPQAVLGECCARKGCTCPGIPVTKSFRQDRWFVVVTENFQVCCQDSAKHAEDLARHAEALRTRLNSQWLGDLPDAGWSPRCQVVLHGSRRAYVNASGRGSESTAGSSLVNTSGSRITSRRIDLLGDREEYLTAALPHELTHVILRDRFVADEPPVWADEGVAILADPLAKQGRHQQDLAESHENNTGFSTGELLATSSYPRPDRIGAFYAQSASLVRFLVSQENPERFVEFLEQASLQGYDAALRKCYGVDGVVELDRKWRQHLRTPSVSLTRAARPM